MLYRREWDLSRVSHLDKVRGRMESSSHSSIRYVSELADRREANK